MLDVGEVGVHHTAPASVITTVFTPVPPSTVCNPKLADAATERPAAAARQGAGCGSSDEDVVTAAAGRTGDRAQLIVADHMTAARHVAGGMGRHGLPAEGGGAVAEIDEYPGGIAAVVDQSGGVLTDPAASTLTVKWPVAVLPSALVARTSKV